MTKLAFEMNEQYNTLHIIYSEILMMLDFTCASAWNETQSQLYSANVTNELKTITTEAKKCRSDRKSHNKIVFPKSCPFYHFGNAHAISIVVALFNSNKSRNVIFKNYWLK